MIHPLRVRQLLALVLILVLLFFARRPLDATTSRKGEVPCPLCNATVTGQLIMSTNTFGGSDLDSCPRPRGTPTVPLAMWSCTTCGFTGYHNEFTATMSAAVRLDLRDWLTQTVSPASFPRTSWEKYDLSARRAIHQKAPDIDVGFLFLRAAWCCRFLGEIPVPDRSRPRMGEHESQVADQLLRKVQEVLKDREAGIPEAFISLEIASAAADIYTREPLLDVQRPAWSLFVSIYYRTVGEHSPALRWLDTVDQLKPSPEIASISAGLRRSIEQEKYYQSLALDPLIRAISQASNTPDLQARLITVVADTCRRLEQKAEAERWFRKALETPALPEDVELVAIQGLRLMGITYTHTPERQTRLKTQRTERYLQNLLDPEKAREAITFLRLSPNPDTIPRLLSLLENPDATVQDNALRCLNINDPRALKALVDRIDHPDFRRTVLRILAGIGNPSVVPELATRLQATPFLNPMATDSVYFESQVGHLAGTLAIIGGPEATAALVEKSFHAFVDNLVWRELEPGDQDSPEARHIRCCQDLAQALGFCDDVAAIKPLARALLIKNDYLQRCAGISLEQITNHHFGFSKLEKPGEPTGMEQETPLEDAMSSWRGWYKSSREETRDSWVMNGFVKAGYSVLPESDPGRLEELIRGLDDLHKNIRYNCYMELGRRTGKWFRRDSIRGLNSPIDFLYAAKDFRKWLTENKGALTWDEKLRRFMPTR